jgi:hypothetical protein
MAAYPYLQRPDNLAGPDYSRDLDVGGHKEMSSILADQ